MKKNRFYESVHNYTKYKLVEMLIEKHQDKFEDIDTIEDVTEDILKILALSGLKFYGHMKKENG
tara:strand:+ start:379 stop:570 length:192 start_codon:yes stop_codon:yes gene_type:complete